MNIARAGAVRIIRAALDHFVRLTHALIRVAAWLLLAPILCTLGMSVILVRFTFAAPMIAWRAAKGKDTSRP